MLGTIEESTHYILWFSTKLKAHKADAESFSFPLERERSEPIIPLPCNKDVQSGQLDKAVAWWHEGRRVRRSLLHDAPTFSTESPLPGRWPRTLDPTARHTV